MVTARFQGVVRRLRQTALCDQSLSDGELLERYLAQRDETAFAALVRRHGPMVLGVCRRVLADAHDADDAFQATFLVLVKKANVILPRERVGPWLYGVAYRTSLKAKTMNSRRRAKQKTLEDVPSPPASLDTDWLALLDQEVARLPDKYRLPIVLCDLEGKTRKQAARQLGWPEGTVSTRLQHGRALVHKRLTRRGLTLSAGALTLAWAQAVSAAAVPGPLVTSTVQTASAFAAGNAAGVVPLKIVALTQGVLQAMVFNKVKNASALLVMVAILGLSLGGLTGGLRTAAAQVPPAVQAPPPVQEVPITRVVPPVAESLHRSPMEKNEGLLPTGPAPVQALVSLDKDKVVVKTNQLFAQPRTVRDTFLRSYTFYEAVNMLRTDRYERAAVEVYDTSRRKLDSKDMAKWLKEEIPALVLVGTKAIDPLHLRLIKEGTLIFVLPAPPTPPPPAVYQETPHVLPDGTVMPRTTPTVPQTAPPITEYLPPPPAVENPPVAPSPVLPPQPPPRSSIEQAERELAIAEFYLKTGHRGSAAFYYEMIGRRYPGTSYAQRAAQFLKELPRPEKSVAATGQPPVRVGEIIIVGNRKIPDAVILENMPLYPGQVLNYNDLRVAEDNLSRLDAFVNASPVVKLRPIVTVLESHGQFKDILVTVQESLRLDVLAEMKKLQGTWTIIAMSHGKMEKMTPDGPEIVISGDQLTNKSKQSAARSSYVLDLSTTPKGIRLTPLDGASGAQPWSGSYEIDGGTLKLMLRSGMPSSGGAGTVGPETTMILKRKGNVTTEERKYDQSGQVHPPQERRATSLEAIPGFEVLNAKFRYKSSTMAIDADTFSILTDGRVELTNAAITMFPNEDRRFPQLIRAARILLKMDGPFHTFDEFRTRNVLSMEIRDAIVTQQRD